MGGTDECTFSTLSCTKKNRFSLSFCVHVLVPCCVNRPSTPKILADDVPSSPSVPLPQFSSSRSASLVLFLSNIYIHTHFLFVYSSFILSITNMLMFSDQHLVQSSIFGIYCSPHTNVQDRFGVVVCEKRLGKNSCLLPAFVALQIANN